MKQTPFARILRSIFETRDDEISCSECFDQISDYVDREIADEVVTKQMLLVRQHLDQCRVCREEYETLLDLARLEAPQDISPQDSTQ